MNQLDMFDGQTDLETPLPDKHLELEATMDFLTRRYWKCMDNGQLTMAGLVRHEITSVGRKLYLADRYHIYCLQCEAVVEGHPTMRRGLQMVVYASNEQQALAFHDMDNVRYQKSGWQDTAHYYTEPTFVDPPAHLLKEDRA